MNSDQIDGLSLIALISLVIGGLIIGVMYVWGIIDAANRPQERWREIDQDKIAWILIQVFLGIVGTIAYFTIVRPKLLAALRLSHAPHRLATMQGLSRNEPLGNPGMQPITFCAHCGVEHDISARRAGTVFFCSECGSEVRVP